MTASMLLETVLVMRTDVEVLSHDGALFALAEGGQALELTHIDREGIFAVLRLVDGQRSVGDIAELLAKEFDSNDVYALLEQLTGTVVDHLPSSMGTPSVEITSAPIAILGVGALARETRRQLASFGFTRVTSLDTSHLTRGEPQSANLQIDLDTTHGRSKPQLGEGGSEAANALVAQVRGLSLLVCAMEGLRGQSLCEVNAACLEAKTPALFATVESDAFVLGPLVIPGRSPCFVCSRLSTTLRPHFESQGSDLLRLGWFGSHSARSPRWILERAAFEIATEVVRALRGDDYPQRVSTLLRIDAAAPETSTAFYAVSTCPACHGHHRAKRFDETVATPTESLSRAESVILDRTGGLRSVTTDEARRRAEGALETLGVALDCSPLPATAPETLLAFECPYFTVRHRVRFSSTLPVVWGRLDDNCYGKGTSESQALCSATFEWIERNMSSWRGDLDLVQGTYRKVRDRAIDMPFLVSGLLSEFPLGDQRHFDQDEEIDWVWGHCLKRQQPILLPAAAVFLGGALFRGSSLELTGRGSSGLSAGCSLGDATLQGLLEIVERDACYVALRNGLRLPAVDPTSISDPATKSLLSRIEAAGYEVHIRDITTEIGIATLEVYLTREAEYTNHFASGYGAHFDPDIALRRAVTEAAQSLFFDVSNGSADPSRALGSVFEVFPHKKQVLERKGDFRSLAQTPRLVDPDEGVWEQIDRLCSRLVATVPRADVCVVDLSLRETPGVHVVRTLITGMLDETRPAQINLPERCRLVPLADMFLGRAM